MIKEDIDIETYFRSEAILSYLDTIDEKLDKYLNEMDKYIECLDCVKNNNLENE